MFYPAYINLQDRKCLVIGGGTVAERKVVAMLISGGDVTVISPDATELVAFLAHNGTIRWHKRQVKAGDTTGYFLVCAATDFTDINTDVFREAHEKNKIRLVNVVDVIPQCTFAAASVVTDGELMISISTSGKSPAMSRRIREHFEKVLHASSLYTLGYEEGEPVPIENQGLPYPVYFLLEGRTCIILCKQKTPEIEHRISLLNRCDAATVCIAPDKLKPHHLEDAFLVVADTAISREWKGGKNGRMGPNLPTFQPSNLSAENRKQPESQESLVAIWECLDEPSAGTYFTPELVIDGNLIISVSPRNIGAVCNRTSFKSRHLHRRGEVTSSLSNQFENNGYGAFIEFLGTLRPQVLKAFSTSKKRAEFFDTLIDYVEPVASNQLSVASKGEETPKQKHSSLETGNWKLETSPQTCCFRLANRECSAECLFNWIRSGNLERANTFTSDLLTAESRKPKAV